MDIYKKSPAVVLDAVPDPDGVYRVPPIVEQWKVHYQFTHDYAAIDDEIRIRMGEKMVRDLEKMTRDLFRYSASS